MPNESSKEKLDQDYQDSEKNIEALANEEIERIRKKMDTLKREAAKVGGLVEAELDESEPKSSGKNVNTHAKQM